MNVFLFTDDRSLAARFRIGDQRSGAFRLSVCAWKEFRRKAAEIAAPALFYLDLSGLAEEKLASSLRLIRKNQNILYGLIDPARKIKDIARIFHEGAVDYLDRTVLQADVTIKRLERVLGFISPEEERTAREPADRSAEPRYSPSGKDWTKVVPEREYTFTLLFIELDGKEEMEKKYGMKNLSIALSSFRDYIEGSVKGFGGRLWIWSGFGGIILFPFDGVACQAVTCCFRLMLFKHLYDIEQSLFPHFLSFRLALDLGNVIYTERNIGSVIADSLNSIFHLGQDFLGSFVFSNLLFVRSLCYCMEEVHPLLDGAPMKPGYGQDSGRDGRVEFSAGGGDGARRQD